VFFEMAVRSRSLFCLPVQRLGGLSYFAGAEKKDDRVLVPDLGSLTSIHDRWVGENKVAYIAFSDHNHILRKTSGYFRLVVAHCFSFFNKRLRLCLLL
jgi:hypothetical protein